MTALRLLGPLLLAGMGARLVMAEGGVCERPFEAFPGDLGISGVYAW
jgi:hypothetical protein